MGCPEYWLQTPLWHFIANIGLFIKTLDMKLSSSESEQLLAANFHKIVWNDCRRWPVFTSQMFVNIWRKVKCFCSSDEKDFISKISYAQNYFFLFWSKDQTGQYMSPQSWHSMERQLTRRWIQVLIRLTSMYGEYVWTQKCRICCVFIGQLFI